MSGSGKSFALLLLLAFGLGVSAARAELAVAADFPLPAVTSADVTKKVVAQYKRDVQALAKPATSEASDSAAVRK